MTRLNNTNRTLPNFRSSKIEIKHLKKTTRRLNLQDVFRRPSIYLQLKDVYKWVTIYTNYQLKIKEALHIEWERPPLNKRLKHVNLTLLL